MEEQFKQFNLEEYLKNSNDKIIVTREGKPVRILCTDKMDSNVPIVGLVRTGNCEETVEWSKTGRFFPIGRDCRYDLFFAPATYRYL